MPLGINFPALFLIFTVLPRLVGQEVALASEEAAMAPATANKASSKKRKLAPTGDGSGSAVAEGPLQEAPRAQLQGHSQCVSGVAWPNQDVIYSCSWDHSVSHQLGHQLLVEHCQK